MKLTKPLFELNYVCYKVTVDVAKENEGAEFKLIAFRDNRQTCCFIFVPSLALKFAQMT